MKNFFWTASLPLRVSVNFPLELLIGLLAGSSDDVRSLILQKPEGDLFSVVARTLRQSTIWISRVKLWARIEARL